MLITKLGGGIRGSHFTCWIKDHRAHYHTADERFRRIFFFPEHLLPPSQRDINGNTRWVLISMNPSSNSLFLQTYRVVVTICKKTKKEYGVSLIIQLRVCQLRSSKDGLNFIMHHDPYQRKTLLIEPEGTQATDVHKNKTDRCVFLIYFLSKLIPHVLKKKKKKPVYLSVWLHPEDTKHLAGFVERLNLVKRGILKKKKRDRRSERWSTRTAHRRSAF